MTDAEKVLMLRAALELALESTRCRNTRCNHSWHPKGRAALLATAAPATGPHGPAVEGGPYTLEEWDREETQDDGSPLPRGYGSQHPANRYDEEDPRLRATVVALAAAEDELRRLKT